MASPYDTNRNARIRSRTLRNGNIRTETAQRDSGIKVSVTKTKSGATRLSVTDTSGLVTRLNGHEARTLFRVLAKHYAGNGASLDPIY